MDQFFELVSLEVAELVILNIGNFCALFLIAFCFADHAFVCLVELDVQLGLHSTLVDTKLGKDVELELTEDLWRVTFQHHHYSFFICKELSGESFARCERPLHHVSLHLNLSFVTSLVHLQLCNELISLDITKLCAHF